MRTKLKTLLALSAAIMGVACATRQTDSTGPGTTDDRLTGVTVDGNWAHTAIGPVYREFMTLAQTGNSIVGRGSYAIEAGRTGPTSITGTITAGAVALTITRDDGQVETFAGTLSDASHLDGTLSVGGVRLSFGFVKGEKQ